MSGPTHALLALLAKINYAPSLFHTNVRLSVYRPEATNNTQRIICHTHSQVNATLVCLKSQQSLGRHMDPHTDNALKESAQSNSDNLLSKYLLHRLMMTTYKHPSKESKLLFSTFSWAHKHTQTHRLNMSRHRTYWPQQHSKQESKASLTLRVVLDL